MKKVLSAILTPVFFLIFGLLLGVFHPIQVVTRNLFGPKAHDKTVAILNLSLMKSLVILGTRLKFINFKSIPTDVPIIVISNHQSMWDIPTLIWKFRAHRLKFVAKKELARFIPSISYNLKYGGSVSIDRSKPDESIKKIKTFAKYVKSNNLGVCIFPEGTRSRNGKIKPFKVGGINAVLTEIPNALVVPVAIKNTGIIDNDGKYLKNLGVRASYTMLEPRNVDLKNLEDEIKSIQQEIKTIIEA